MFRKDCSNLLRWEEQLLVEIVGGETWKNKEEEVNWEAENKADENERAEGGLSCIAITWKIGKRIKASQRKVKGISLRRQRRASQRIRLIKRAITHQEATKAIAKLVTRIAK